VTSEALGQLFAPHGKVDSAEVIIDRDTGGQGFGFVEMGTDQEAQAAIAALNGQENDGRKLIVNEARPASPALAAAAGRPKPLLICACRVTSHGPPPSGVARFFVPGPPRWPGLRLPPPAPQA